MWSHSTRVRGLKCCGGGRPSDRRRVALYTSAWIEIMLIFMMDSRFSVALYTSAWIEISLNSASDMSGSSHSTRVRGLKFLTIRIFQIPL